MITILPNSADHCMAEIKIFQSGGPLLENFPRQLISAVMVYVTF